MSLRPLPPNPRMQPIYSALASARQSLKCNGCTDCDATRVESAIKYLIEAVEALARKQEGG